MFMAFIIILFVIVLSKCSTCSKDKRDSNNTFYNNIFCDKASGSALFLIFHKISDSCS